MKKNKVVILGAGTPFHGEGPAALTQIPGHQRVLDWMLDAFSAVQPAEVHYVGGYKLQKIIQKYPQISFTLNPDWKDSGSLGSLLMAPLEHAKTVYVSYADIVFRPSVVRAMSEAAGEVVIVADRKWRDRYEDRTSEDIKIAEKVNVLNGMLRQIGKDVDPDLATGEFIGLMKMSDVAVEKLRYLSEKDASMMKEASLPDAVEIIQRAGITVKVLEIEGEWAELNAPQDLARFLLGNKATTLSRLRPLVRKCVIDDQVSFSSGDWQNNPDSVMRKIKRKFGDSLLAVRSSALTEDNWTVSAAGKFTSLLNVSREELKGSIDEVIASYGDDDLRHLVLVQRMLKTVTMSGVIFTRTLTHGAPYYVINYDDVTTDTDSVTSGKGSDLKIFISFKARNHAESDIPGSIRPVVNAAVELESLVGYDSLDIEFAVEKSGAVHILQLRPIAVEHSSDAVSDGKLAAALGESVDLFRSKQRPGPFLKGKRTFFGVMPDWNPAEIIGTKPSALAFSLYRSLILDDVWARQRAEFGYRNVRPSQLMLAFAGHPYIDIRASFNSFIPACLPDDLTERLVDHYLDKIEENPHLHDKVEFEILFTCLTFDFDRQAGERLSPAGFNTNEIRQLKDALRNITTNAFDRLEGDIEKIRLLEERQEQVISEDLHPLDKARMLLEDVREYGTLPFAHLARNGFVAVALLRSLEEEGVLGSGTADEFINSLNTVARQFEQDGAAVGTGHLEWSEFVARYGHLRPGTYSITSEKYADNPDKYLRHMVGHSSPNAPLKDVAKLWDSKIRNQVGERLENLGLPANVDNFIGYIKKAIEGREFSKFVFTRSLSNALDCFAKYGAEYGLDRDRLSNLSLPDFWDLRSGMAGGDVKTFLQTRIDSNSEIYQLAQSIELPPLILKTADFYSFHLPKSQPNFVSKKSIVNECVRLSSLVEPADSLKGNIILIPQADPGFDWLFGYEIGGLITMYGGANSHMAIRAAELGIPAAIGVGESLFESLCRARVVSLDCRNRDVRVVK